jgi:hypothetical protein
MNRADWLKLKVAEMESDREPQPPAWKRAGAAFLQGLTKMPWWPMVSKTALGVNWAQTQASEYYNKPIAAGITSPAWALQRTPEGIKPTEQGQAFFSNIEQATREGGVPGFMKAYVGAFRPGGVARKGYEEWEVHPAAKFGAELVGDLPFIIPAIQAAWKSIKAYRATLTTDKARNILGVSKTATDAEIKSAYRRLTFKYHPDVSTVPNAQAKFTEVNAAYDLLTKRVSQAVASYKPSGPIKTTGRELVPSGGQSTITPIILPGGEAVTPAPGALATSAQKIRAHSIAYSHGLLDPKTKAVTPAYRRLAKGITGHPTMLKMTETQADTFIEALNSLETKGGRPPKIPGTTNLIPKAMADKIPHLKEIGLKEKVRPSRQVFTKMGLLEEVWRPAFETETIVNEKLAAFDKTISSLEKTIGGDIESRRRIFQALENPELITDLTETEYKAHQWFKNYFDKRADDLNLPIGKRRQNYVTHIFEHDITKSLQEQNQMPFELIRALDFITPKRVFNPYLKERLGRELGLKEDPFAAARAYEYRALRDINYTPLIQKIRVWEKFLPPASQKYLRGFINRMSNRPLAMDREMATTLKELGEAVEKIPGGKRLSKLTEFLGGQKAGQLAAYRFTNMLYFSWLGFKATSAIRNLSQNFLTIAEVGPVNFFKGINNKAATNAAKESLVLRSRRKAYLPGIEDGLSGGWTTKTREASMAMFRAADRVNVTNAFKAGYTEARGLKLPHDWAVKRGDEVAADTQYLYTKLAGASWSQTALGRIAAPLTTWPENWIELMGRWFKGRPSQTYKAYKEATGIDVEGQMNWFDRKKSLFIYSAIVTGAYYAQKQTRVRALEYTGFTSIQYLADILSGDLPALSIPGAAAQVAAGFVTRNDWMLRQGISNLKPDRLMGAYRLARRVVQGEADWLTLLLYLSPKGTLPKEGEIKPDWGKISPSRTPSPALKPKWK